MFFTRYKTYYLDTAATTKVSREAVRAMKVFWRDKFYNPRSIYRGGIEVQAVLSKIQTRTLALLNAKSNDHVVWTAGGSDSNRIAIDAVLTHALAREENKVGTIIISAIEHSSITDYLVYRKHPLIKVVEIPVDVHGQVILKKFSTIIEQADNPLMVSVMFQSSEVGTTQPIAHIARITREVCRKRGIKTPLIHSDMSQGIYVAMPNVQHLGIDMLTICGQKIEAPKGVGALYVSDEYKKIMPKQGTPSVPLIVGMVTQLEYIAVSRDAYTAYIQKTRKRLFEELDRQAVAYTCNGKKDELSHICNVSFTECMKDSESLIVACDSLKLELSSKSACMGSQKEDSQVLQKMGQTPANSLRISFLPHLRYGIFTEGDVQEIVRRLKKVTQSKD